MATEPPICIYMVKGVCRSPSWCRWSVKGDVKKCSVEGVVGTDVLTPKTPTDYTTKNGYERSGL